MLLKKPQPSARVLQSITKAFSTLNSDKKITLINTLDNWSVVTDVQLKSVLEQASASAHERQLLKNLVARVGAFQIPTPKYQVFDDEIPF